MLERIATRAGWLLIVLMTITCVDVVCRKLSIPIPYTKFRRWSGTCTPPSSRCGWATATSSTRIRASTPTPRRCRSACRAWIELAGCLLFALPYMALIVYFGLDFLIISYLQGEGSENVAGLHHRWIIKGVFVLGLLLVLVAIVSVILRLVVYLFGRRPQEQVNLQIGHAVSEV